MPESAASFLSRGCQAMATSTFVVLDHYWVLTVITASSCRNHDFCSSIHRYVIGYGWSLISIILYRAFSSFFFSFDWRKKVVALCFSRGMYAILLVGYILSDIKSLWTMINHENFDACPITFVVSRLLLVFFFTRTRCLLISYLV